MLGFGRLGHRRFIRHGLLAVQARTTRQPRGYQRGRRDSPSGQRPKGDISRTPGARSPQTRARLNLAHARSTVQAREGQAMHPEGDAGAVWVQDSKGRFNGL